MLAVITVLPPSPFSRPSISAVVHRDGCITACAFSLARPRLSVNRVDSAQVYAMYISSAC
jgi:hypothetical protein